MKILITGAGGQIGSELMMQLQNLHGRDNIICSDIDISRIDPHSVAEKLDVTDAAALSDILDRHKIDRIYHLAAILSGNGENHPQLAYHVNMSGVYNVLEAARERRLDRVFVPSSIAVFGEGIDRDNTSDDSLLRPGTMYGVTKVAGELLFEYYRNKFGLDVRSIRFPGVISWKTEPGGGSTDYAVDIYREALRHGKYTSFVREDTVLPFLYMPDVIRSISELMDAPLENLSRCTYNIGGFSASCGEFASSVRRRFPDFTVDYAPDFRQAIVDAWPRIINDELAAKDWGWKSEYDLQRTADNMLLHLGKIIHGSNIKEAS